MSDHYSELSRKYLNLVYAELEKAKKEGRPTPTWADLDVAVEAAGLPPMQIVAQVGE